jgi:hypothetical protein
MKELKVETRSDNRFQIRSVSLQIRDYQVTARVRSAVPQAPVSTAVRASIR